MKRIPWGERAAWKLCLEVLGGGFHWDVTERASLCLPPVMGLWGSEMDVEPGRHEAKQSGPVSGKDRAGAGLGGSANPALVVLVLSSSPLLFLANWEGTNQHLAFFHSEGQEPHFSVLPEPSFPCRPGGLWSLLLVLQRHC